MHGLSVTHRMLRLCKACSRSLQIDGHLYVLVAALPTGGTHGMKLQAVTKVDKVAQSWLTLVCHFARLCDS